jgi:Flp pilus assembly protein TadD
VRGAPARPARRYGWGWRTVASTALVVLAVSWLPPYLSGRAHNSALTAASDGRVAVALVHARRAASLDPLAVDPLLTEARLLEQLGRARDALARLRAAAKLQPNDYEVWYELGALEHGTLGHDTSARAALTRALALNPDDAASRFELELIAR